MGGVSPPCRFIAIGLQGWDPLEAGPMPRPEDATMTQPSETQSAPLDSLSEALLSNSRRDARPHACKGGEESTADSRPEYDAQGIYLCRVCDVCQAEKLGGYRPEILNGYSQEDVSEPIEGEAF